MEGGVLLIRFERLSAVCRAMARVDLIPYAFPQLSDVRPSRTIFSAARGSRQGAKYEADQS